MSVISFDSSVEKIHHESDPFLDLCTDLGSEQKAAMQRDLDIDNHKIESMKSYIQDVVKDRVDIAVEERKILQSRSSLHGDMTGKLEEKGFHDDAITLIRAKHLAFKANFVLDLEEQGIRRTRQGLQSICPGEAYRLFDAAKNVEADLTKEINVKKQKLQTSTKKMESARASNAAKAEKLAAHQGNLNRLAADKHSALTLLDKAKTENNEKEQSLQALQKKLTYELSLKEKDAEKDSTSAKSHLKACETARKELDKLELDIAYCLEQKELANDMLTKTEDQKLQRKQARHGNEEAYARKTEVEAKLGELQKTVAKHKSDKLKYESKVRALIKDQQEKLIALELEAGPMESELGSLVERKAVLGKLLDDNNEPTKNSRVEKLKTDVAAIQKKLDEWVTKYEAATAELDGVREDGLAVTKRIDSGKANVKEQCKALDEEIHALNQDRKTLHKKISAARAEYKNVLSLLEEERKTSVHGILVILASMEKKLTIMYEGGGEPDSVMDEILASCDLPSDVEDHIRGMFA